MVVCTILRQIDFLQMSGPELSSPKAGLIHTHTHTHTHTHLIVKHPAQAVLKAKFCFCPRSDTISACLVFAPFKQLYYREGKDQQKSRERELEKEGIIWARGSVVTYRETQSASTLHRSLALSKPGFFLRGRKHSLSAFRSWLCPALCDPMGCSLPGSSLHEILQARILEWVAFSSSRGSS